MSILIELSEQTEMITVEHYRPVNFLSMLKQVLSGDEFSLKYFAIIQPQAASNVKYHHRNTKQSNPTAIKYHKLIASYKTAHSSSQMKSQQTNNSNQITKEDQNSSMSQYTQKNSQDHMSSINSPELKSKFTSNSPSSHLTQVTQSQHIEIGKSVCTFIRDMQWYFYILLQQLRIRVKFFNYQRDSFLCTNTERIKLQLMILLRTINSHLSAEEEFVINPANNIVEYHFKINWKQYKIKIPKIQSLKRFFMYICKKLRKFQEIVYFIEPPVLNSNSVNEEDSIRLHLHDDHIRSINKYREIMQNTKKLRNINNQYFNRLCELKEYKTTNQFEEMLKNQQMFQIQTLFHHNVNLLYQQSLGLQKSLQNDELYKNCKNKISYHENPKDKCFNMKANEQNYDDSDKNKIVHGIDIVKKQKQKVLSKEGAHSQITRGVFIYRIVKTVEIFTNESEKYKWIGKNQNRNQLTVKRCNHTVQASKNSFMNEIYFLHYARDFQSSFIGKYYLQMKKFRDRNEKDLIYMKSYYQNVDYIIRKCPTLSTKDRLSLIYRISLGLCFLGSRNIIHRDLKPHNIVVNSSLTPHIIDFGSCCSIYGTNSFVVYDKRLLTTKFIHIYYHQIPQNYHYIYEKMTKQEYEQHPLFDIYSFGRVISFIMFNRIDPPHFQEVQNNGYADLLKNLIYLIWMCLNVDPDDRPTIGQVTGFLGSLAKYYGAYQEFFLEKCLSESEGSPKIIKTNIMKSKSESDHCLPNRTD